MRRLFATLALTGLVLTGCAKTLENPFYRGLDLEIELYGLSVPEVIVENPDPEGKKSFFC